MMKLAMKISGKNLVSAKRIISFGEHFENELTQSLQALHCEVGK